MRFVWEDTDTWQPLVKKTGGRRQTPVSMLKAVRETYRDLTVFHAARPLKVDTYYREGLRLADHTKQTSVARTIFLSGKFPEIDEAAFKTAAEQLSDIDNGQSYVSLDKRTFLKDCGHYLIYGSEHVCGIAASLTRNGLRDYRQVLKQFGRPTIFTISLPINTASEADLLEFAELLHEWVPRVRARRRPPKVDFTFMLHINLPSEFILSHDHPTVIIDPLLPMQPVYHYDAPSSTSLELTPT
jgi:hypothetical protein